MVYSSRKQGFHVSSENIRRESPSAINLTETKQYLLDIAKNILGKQKGSQLYPLDLFTIAKTEQKYSESELFQSVSELYDEKWIVPGENITKDKVLEDFDCSNIYDYVKRIPGCDTLDIMNELKISFRRALRSLEILFKFGFIRARVFSQYYLYYQIDSPEELDTLYRLSRNKTVTKILKFLLEKGTPYTSLELARVLKKPSDFIQQKLARLVQAEILSEVPKKSNQYQLNKAIKKLRQEALAHLKNI